MEAEEHRAGALAVGGMSPRESILLMQVTLQPQSEPVERVQSQHKIQETIMEDLAELHLSGQ